MTGTLTHSELVMDASGNPVSIQSSRPITFNDLDFQPTRGNQLQISESGEYKYDHRKLYYRGDVDIVIGDRLTILDNAYTVAAVLPYESHKEIVLNACQ
ncbi:MAG TPA: hypothetical protein PKW59_09765 [Thermotogota bacterium]|nr:hypothetical protein [Thermotogota bacterium]